jgi:hypothetical protein
MDVPSNDPLQMSREQLQLKEQRELWRTTCLSPEKPRKRLKPSSTQAASAGKDAPAGPPKHEFGNAAVLPMSADCPEQAKSVQKPFMDYEKDTELLSQSSQATQGIHAREAVASSVRTSKRAPSRPSRFREVPYNKPDASNDGVTKSQPCKSAYKTNTEAERLQASSQDDGPGTAHAQGTRNVPGCGEKNAELSKSKKRQRGSSRSNVPCDTRKIHANAMKPAVPSGREDNDTQEMATAKVPDVEDVNHKAWLQETEPGLDADALQLTGTEEGNVPAANTASMAHLHGGVAGAADKSGSFATTLVPIVTTLKGSLGDSGADGLAAHVFAGAIEAQPATADHFVNPAGNGSLSQQQQGHPTPQHVKARIKVCELVLFDSICRALKSSMLPV